MTQITQEISKYKEIQFTVDKQLFDKEKELESLRERTKVAERKARLIDDDMKKTKSLADKQVKDMQTMLDITQKENDKLLQIKQDLSDTIKNMN